jgi:hypothetical protein
LLFLYSAHNLAHAKSNSVKVTGDSIEWKLRKDKNGIKVYTRNHEGKGLLEYRATTLIETNMDRLVKMIYDVENYPAWTANCASAEIHEVLSDSSWIEYMVTPVPWPIDNRDVVLKCTVTDHSVDYFEARLTSLPDAVPEKEKYTRVQDSRGSWIFKKADNNRVEIIHQFYGDPEGNIPNWIVNMFIVNGPYNTLLNLKELCADPD